ncbi:glycosyltransferase [uncultured Microbacterium sp.]|uniref:glycosyltransferase n=1 Tax=uncultured Microbacterium sp. TaxID=191216 RepID=UPI0028E2F611|nr:glycosyl transferase [uncultured Microbacterium sp.]
MPDRRLRVMQSFGVPRSTTNPYITMLDEALAAEPSIDHLRFSWGAALRGRYDVFHWHWPEGKLHGSTWWKSTGKFVLTALLSVRHRLSRRIAVVRTVHNIALPEVNAARRRLLVSIDRQTAFRIIINATTPLSAGQRGTLIPHGHYRDWYAPQRHQPRIAGRLGTFGGIRRYKSVDVLLQAYAQASLEERTLSLRIGGKPTTPAIADDVRRRAGALRNVELTLAFLSDAELVELATQSELVVLAYRFMHNSGSVLAALSLGRPVLVPRNVANETLAAEVGDEWVLMYDGELDGRTLVEAWRAASALPSDAMPDLSRREWADAGAAHAAAYREASDIVDARARRYRRRRTP